MASSPKTVRARPSDLAPRPDTPTPPAMIRVADAVLVLAFLALTFLLGVFPLKDTDFWWHLRTGDWIREHTRVPTTDLYTFTVADRPWIDLHWGFQVAISWLYERGGVVALNLAKCVVTCVAVLLLITARRRDWPVWVMLLAWLPALLVLGGRMYVRPETLSLLYLSVYLAVLFRWRDRPALAFVLPVVQLLWVNSHGLFVLGPVLLGMAWIDAALAPGAFAKERRGWWKTVTLATVLTGLACLANPYAIVGAVFPLQLAQTMSNPLFSRSIEELKPILDFIEQAGVWHLYLLLHLGTMVLGALSFLVPMLWTVGTRLSSGPSSDPRTARSATGRAATSRARASKRSRDRDAVREPDRTTWRLSPFRVLLYVAFCALSFQATRNSHQFAAVVGTVTAWNFGEWAAALRRQRLARDPAAPVDRATPRAVAFVAIAAVFVAVASGQFYRVGGEGRTIGLGEQPLWYPHDAARFAGGPGLPERCVAFHLGHAALYSYYNGPQRKVFADARLEVIGPELYGRYVDLQGRIAQNQPGWAAELDALGRPAVLVDHVHAELSALVASLMAHPSWRCVWFDPVASVFVHESYAEVVREHAVDFGARHFQPDPATDPKGMAELLASGKALYQLALNSLGRPDFVRPVITLGQGYARRAEVLAFESWKLQGQLEMLRADASSSGLVPRFRMAFDPVTDLPVIRATYAFQHALEHEPNDFTSVLQLCMLFQQRGMDEAAVPLLERLLQIWPKNQYQALVQRNAEETVVGLRARLGPRPSLKWTNRAKFERLLQELLASGRAETAAEVLAQIPPSARSWEQSDRLATLWLHLGEPERARTVWQTAEGAVSPGLVASRIAATYLTEGNVPDARRFYQQALEAEPDRFEALYGLAVLERDVGRADAALAAARRAQKSAITDLDRLAIRSLLNEVEPFANPSWEDAP